MEVVEQVGRYAGVAATVGLAIFLPLFISQARDIRRLRVWSERDPGAVDEANEAVAASIRAAQQAVIARATGEAEAARAEVKAAARDAVEMTPSAAERVARDRSAAGRTRVERPYQLEEPAWRRWLRRGPGPGQLVWIVAAVFALGLVVALVSLQFADQGDEVAPAPEPTVEGRGVVKADVDVAVLNGTAVAGLAAKVGDDVEANGYALGAVTNSETPAPESRVLFERGHEEEAQAVARDLGVDAVEPIDAEARAVAAGADVVVIAGEDRAQL
jgi:LytR cell envelope-related transcriptional attenuator